MEFVLCHFRLSERKTSVERAEKGEVEPRRGRVLLDGGGPHHQDHLHGESKREAMARAYPQHTGGPYHISSPELTKIRGQARLFTY